MLYLFIFTLIFASVHADDLDIPSNVANRSISVKGTLFCGNKPYEGAKLRLYRTFQKDKADDLSQIVADTQTYITGMFVLEGSTGKFPAAQSELQPFLTIHHTCGMDEKETANTGYKRWSVLIPEDYVTIGTKSRKTYELGKVNLEVEFPGEEHDKKFNFKDQLPK